tara:strand:- start:1239 stop:2159 length:921 start_codon:yes stop_codon:yes gene_type:complete
MELIKRTLQDISEIPTMLQTFAKRSRNVFPPIAKDSMYRLLINKVTWVIILILLLPCILGFIIYYETDQDRQFEEIDGDKIYYNPDGDLIHEEKIDAFTGQAYMIIIILVAAIIAILFSSELINEEYEKKTMQLLRTTPVHSFEILLYRYITGVICMFGILGIASIMLYYTTMMPSGLHGILENLDVLLMVLKVLLFESIAFMAVFCMFTIYFEKPFLVGIIYWAVWERIVSTGNYQKLTVTHYLDSIMFDSAKDMNLDLDADFFNLVNSNDEIIATEPLNAILIIIIFAIFALWIGARGIANKQF